jgi:hypothetical protein
MTSPYRLSHKLYIMQDNYIVYYPLQFSCLIASQTGKIRSFSKIQEKYRLIRLAAPKGRRIYRSESLKVNYSNNSNKM